jgi:hypothetical protein
LEAFLRAVLAAVGLALGSLIFCIYSRRDLGLGAALKLTRMFLVPGIDESVPAGPVCLVEAAARRFRPTRRALLLAGLLSFGVAYVTHRLSPGVGRYFYVITENPAAPIQALGALASEKPTLLPETRIELVSEVAWALIFALLTVARLRATELGRQVALLIGVPSGVLLVMHARSHYANPGFARHRATYTVMAGVLLPLVAVVARNLSDRFFKAVTREPPVPPPNPVAGVREARRVPTLLLALLASAGYVVWLHRAYRDPPRVTPTPAEEALMREWEDFTAGKLSPSAMTALVEKATSIHHDARARVGEDDPLCVESNMTVLHFPGAKEEVASETNVLVDGEPWPTPLKSWCSSYGYGGVSRRGRLALRGLAPGLHEIALVTSMAVAHGGAVIWSRSYSTSHEVRVVAGTVRGEIALVTPARFDPDFFLYPSERQNDPEIVWFHTEKAPVTVVSKVQVFDEKGVLLDTQGLGANKGESGSITLWVKYWSKLAPGSHTLRLFVTPDPDRVLENSATNDEILGVSWQREFTVEKTEASKD